MWKDFHQNVYIESRCYRTGKYTVCRRFRASFSPENLQAGAVKGLINRMRFLSTLSPKFLPSKTPILNSETAITKLWNERFPLLQMTPTPSSEIRALLFKQVQGTICTPVRRYALAIARVHKQITQTKGTATYNPTTVNSEPKISTPILTEELPPPPPLSCTAKQADY